MYLEDINQYRKLDSDEWVYLAFETECEYSDLNNQLTRLSSLINCKLTKNQSVFLTEFISLLPHIWLIYEFTDYASRFLSTNKDVTCENKSLLLLISDYYNSIFELID